MEDNQVLKTSEEWYRELHPTGEVKILDPDGWDRLNFHHSYYVEKITQYEFEGRFIRSTITYEPKDSMKYKHNDRSGIVTMNSGYKINLHNPDVSNIKIEDIAHNLSRICRWNGLPYDFMSVAEHCTRVANRVPFEYQLGALLHDSEESILGDNITPLKDVIPQLITLGDKIRTLIVERYEAKYSWDIINIADMEEKDWEWENIIQNRNHVGMQPEEAKEVFLYTFHKLFKG